MLKNLRLLVALITVISIASAISSCKDEEPTPPRISLGSVDPISVSESAGTVEIEVVLDKAYSKDITVEYTLEGSAEDIETASNPALADYQVAGGSGEVDIDKGETTGVIRIDITNDNAFEEDETIVIHLDAVEDEDLEITNDDEITITITNDDQKVTASITTPTFTLTESDGVDPVSGQAKLLEVGVSIDKPAPANLIVKYQLGGTAIDTLTGTNEDIPAAYWDYYVKGVSGEVAIAAGQTSGKVEIQIYTDFIYEQTETIEVTLVASPGVDVSSNNKATINLQQQNGKAIQLSWEDHEDDVDMDLFLWIGEDVTNTDEMGLLTLSANAGENPAFELIFVPDLFVSGAFGLSYVYYSGSADPMNFKVQFIDVIDGAGEPAATREVFDVTYTAANKNPWDSNTGTQPAIVQTFTIEDGAFTNISGVTVPASGSRIRTNKTIPLAKSRAFIHAPTLKRR